MASQEHLVALCGCDDHTYVRMELTLSEAATLRKLAAGATAEALTDTPCKPAMFVVPHSVWVSDDCPVGMYPETEEHRQAAWDAAPVVPRG
jgi:hypothetical protein